MENVKNNEKQKDTHKFRQNKYEGEENEDAKNEIMEKTKSSLNKATNRMKRRKGK